MFKFNYLTSYRIFGLRKPTQTLHNFYCIRNSSSSSNNNEHDDKKPETNKKKDQKSNKESVEKLNLLLQRIVQEDIVKKESNIQLAQPKKSERKPKPAPPENIESAAKSVAESLGGDVKQTESELLTKLLNVNQVENESPTETLQDIIKGMKIDRETKAPEQQSRAQQVKQILNRRQMQQPKMSERKPRRAPLPRQDREIPVKIEKIDLFGNQGLGIFTDPSSLKESSSNKTWEKLYQRDLRLAVTHPPANYFQQMILWTEQGKVWKFPIDNEQGLEAEKQVCFSEHVFLEKYLEPWCPQKGPIRHFMELVCVGLSKNPYLTVDMKKEHLEWYQNYFESKRKLLEDVEAFPKETTKNKETHKVADK